MVLKIRKVTQADLKIGMLIPWDVYGENGGLLVRKGHMVASANQIDALVERGQFEDHSETPAAPREPDSVLRKLNAAHLELQQLLNGIASSVAPAGLQRKLEDVAQLIDDALELNVDVALASILHNQTDAPYAVRHSVDTAVVAQVVARALKKPAAELRTMTLAALTMNVGMLDQAERLENVRTALPAADTQYVRAHPQASVMLLRRAGISDPDWLACVLAHHENEDASGYPVGLASERIPAGAKLIALADRYCARVSQRAGRKSMLPNAALRDILLEAKNTLDGQLAGVLIRELGIYPIGTYVRLSNGEIGVVSRKGLSSTAPHVEVIVGPRGAPLEVFLQRSTGELHSIREVLAAAQVQAPFRMEQIWGRVAAL